MQEAQNYTILVEAKDHGEKMQLSSTSTVILNLIGKHKHQAQLAERTVSEQTCFCLQSFQMLLFRSCYAGWIVFDDELRTNSDWGKSRSTLMSFPLTVYSERCWWLLSIQEDNETSGCNGEKGDRTDAGRQQTGHVSVWGDGWHYSFQSRPVQPTVTLWADWRRPGEMEASV